MKKISDLLPEGKFYPDSTLPPIKNSGWSPSAQDVSQLLRSLGWPFFEDIRVDHLEGEKRKKLQDAKDDLVAYAGRLRGDHGGESGIVIASASGAGWEESGLGCGKTTMARAVLRTVGVVVYSSSAGPSSMLYEQRGTYLEAGSALRLFEESGWTPRAKDWGKLVVIDDLGRETSLQYESRDPAAQQKQKQHRWGILINYFYENRIPVLITSNFTSRDLATAVGDAAWSRLMAMAHTVRINLTGIPDYRPKVAEQTKQDLGADFDS